MTNFMSRLLLALIMLTLILGDYVAAAATPTVQSAELTAVQVSVVDANRTFLYRARRYEIDCEMSSPPDTLVIRNPDNWAVFSDGKPVKLDTATWTNTDPLAVQLYGHFTGIENLTVAFLQGEPVQVMIDTATIRKVVWGFGKGKAMDVDFRRLAGQKSLLAFDYDGMVKFIQCNLMLPSRGIWIPSVSMDLISTRSIGTI